MNVTFLRMKLPTGKIAADANLFAVDMSTVVFSDIADRMGVPYLQRTLSLQLTEHILKCLPDLKRELQARHRDLSKEVAEYRANAMFETSSTSDTKALVG